MSDFVIVFHRSNVVLRRSLDRALMAQTDGIGPTWVQPHVSASYYLFPASDNVAHIMGSCTALRWGRKLIRIVCIEGNDLITWQIISCSNLTESNSLLDSRLFYCILLMSPKIEVPLTKERFVRFLSLQLSCGLCYNPCRCRFTKPSITIDNLNWLWWAVCHQEWVPMGPFYIKQTASSVTFCVPSKQCFPNNGGCGRWSRSLVISSEAPRLCLFRL